MTARRLLTVVYGLLAESRDSDELDELLRPPSRSEERARRREFAAKLGAA